MAARDLVQRSRATRAGISVRMTEAGSQLLATARPIHAAGVRRNFLDLLTPEDIEGLIAITGRLRQSASGFIE